ncbi:splicing factor 3B subunit 4 [Angomonas deanei]|uniref:RNA recognition motif. (A.k.a. RRM, RBD, or RNP domain), putative n=1 Tax=Angomonas deanei TaxID=59799 RepID=A0A7G2C113_9TRYP|nr:splicing factor 3B subunit 4 [Angomonas deanei]CAD2213410.1 RNA recognition motif. (a.k.a. RRM, RBD, or RNP domain), putative [Angomonas deanei]|eukprot:EPY30711.1 splicing factor 3B subunit 4 [Angomonas deanei]
MKISWPSMITVHGVEQRQPFCYVDFYCSEDAKYCYEALSLYPISLYGRPVRVSHASTDLANREAGLKSVMSGLTTSLYEIGAKVVVRNLDKTLTEFEVTEFFEQFGAFAVPPRMKRDELGAFKGVAILSYKDFSFSDKLIDEMNDKVFRDRTISVQYARLEDGSGLLHGNETERANAKLIQEEERKYQENIRKQTLEQDRANRAARSDDTSWRKPLQPRADVRRP